jgi:predicted SAM-dependent methyltransferase
VALSRGLRGGGQQRALHRARLRRGRARLSGEAFRVLRPGGVIRTSTPDLAGIAEALAERDARTLEIHRSHGYEAATHGELVNNYVYSFGHRRLYDEETLALMLREAGFADARRQAYGESDHDVLRGIDRHDPEGLDKFVLCVEAVKPS